MHYRKAQIISKENHSKKNQNDPAAGKLNNLLNTLKSGSYKIEDLKKTDNSVKASFTNSSRALDLIDSISFGSFEASIAKEFGSLQF